LELMKQNGFSQIPISGGHEIIGVFSYRSFSLGALHFEDDRTNVFKLSVAEFLEDLPFRSVKDAFDDVIDDVEEYDAVLVGSPDQLTAIITAMDILRYLYGATSPYVVIAEIVAEASVTRRLVKRRLLKGISRVSHHEQSAKAGLVMVDDAGRRSIRGILAESRWMISTPTLYGPTSKTLSC